MKGRVGGVEVDEIYAKEPQRFVEKMKTGGSTLSSTNTGPDRVFRGQTR